MASACESLVLRREGAYHRQERQCRGIGTQNSRTQREQCRAVPLGILGFVVREAPFRANYDEHAARRGERLKQSLIQRGMRRELPRKEHALIRSKTLEQGVEPHRLRYLGNVDPSALLRGAPSEAAPARKLLLANAARDATLAIKRKKRVRAKFGALLDNQLHAPSLRNRLSDVASQHAARDGPLAGTTEQLRTNHWPRFADRRLKGGRRGIDDLDAIAALESQHARDLVRVASIDLHNAADLACALDEESACPAHAAITPGGTRPSRARRSCAFRWRRRLRVHTPRADLAAASSAWSERRRSP